MSLIDEYILERTCTYKGETYKVRDNGAVCRQPRPEGRLRKDDGKWTFGVKNETNGYMYLGQHRVHIIVATAFLGEKDSKVYVVDHIDTNRCNNRAENLRWLTRLENALLNEDTCRKITYLCGGDIMKFINNPSCLRDLTNDPDISWMRTVTAEEAKAAYTRVQAMQVQRTSRVVKDKHIENEELKRQEQAEAMAYFRVQNNQNNDWHFTAPKQPVTHTPDPVFTKALYPETALQKDWKTPTEFLCCPTKSSNTPLQDYNNNLAVGKPFSQNKYCKHTVLDFALVNSGKTLIIATKDTNPDAIKHFGLLKVYHSGIRFIHESISTYFEENGVRKYFALEQGLTWDGPDSIDDYC